MPGPLLLGIPLIPLAVNTVVGVAATVAATRLVSGVTPTDAPTSTDAAKGSLRFWDDGIDAKEAAMIGAVGLSALAVALIVSNGRKS